MNASRFAAVGLSVLALAVSQAYADTLTVDLPGEAWTGGFGIVPIEAGDLPAGSVLQSISIDVSIASGSTSSWTSDLVIVVTNPGLSQPYLLQVGGFSNFGADTRIDWVSQVTGWNPIAETVGGLSSLGLDLNGYDLFIGNGWGTSPATAWVGTVAIEYASAVPEPGTYGLMALGMAGIALAVRRRTAAAKA